MLIGIQAKTRNGHMLRWRTEYGLNQTQAAAAAEVSASAWSAFECMNYTAGGCSATMATRIGDLVGVANELIWPPEVRGKNKRRKLGLTMTAYREVPNERLLNAQSQQHYILPDPSRVAAKNELQERLPGVLRSLLRTLTERERHIINLRYGLGGGHVYTATEVAKRVGLTRARVRQVEMEALHKLQHPARTAKLAELLDMDPEGQG